MSGAVPPRLAARLLIAVALVVSTALPSQAGSHATVIAVSPFVERHLDDIKITLRALESLPARSPFAGRYQLRRKYVAPHDLRNGDGAGLEDEYHAVVMTSTEWDDVATARLKTEFNVRLARRFTLELVALSHEASQRAVNVKPAHWSAPGRGIFHRVWKRAIHACLHSRLKDGEQSFNGQFEKKTRLILVGFVPFASSAIGTALLRDAGWNPSYPVPYFHPEKQTERAASECVRKLGYPVNRLSLRQVADRIDLTENDIEDLRAKLPHDWIGQSLHVTERLVIVTPAGSGRLDALDGALGQAYALEKARAEATSEGGRTARLVKGWFALSTSDASARALEAHYYEPGKRAKAKLEGEGFTLEQIRENLRVRKPSDKALAFLDEMVLHFDAVDRARPLGFTPNVAWSLYWTAVAKDILHQHALLANDAERSSQYLLDAQERLARLDGELDPVRAEPEFADVAKVAKSLKPVLERSVGSRVRP